MTTAAAAGLKVLLKVELFSRSPIHLQIETEMQFSSFPSSSLSWENNKKEMVLLLIIIQPVSVETLNFYFCIYSRPLFHLVADPASLFSLFRSRPCYCCVLNTSTSDRNIQVKLTFSCAYVIVLLLLLITESQQSEQLMHTLNNKVHSTALNIF